jgi:hypothetical protein
LINYNDNDDNDNNKEDDDDDDDDNDDVNNDDNDKDDDDGNKDDSDNHQNNFSLIPQQFELTIIFASSSMTNKLVQTKVIRFIRVIWDFSIWINFILLSD